MKDWSTPPKFVSLSLYSDGTFNVDFFDKRDKAEGWKQFEENKNGKYDRDVQVFIYEPAKEVSE